MLSLKEKNENSVVDLYPKLRKSGKNIIDRMSNAFLDLYKTINVECAFEFLHNQVPKQLRQQVLDLALDKLEKEEAEALIGWLND